jgi:hypothetical protein
MHGLGGDEVIRMTFPTGSQELRGDLPFWTISAVREESGKNDVLDHIAKIQVTARVPAS